MIRSSSYPRITSILLFILLLYSSLCALCPRCSGPFNPENVPEFRGIGFGEETGLVLRTFKINVPGAPYAHNPSIIPNKKGYTLAFRHDPSSNKLGNPKTFLGCVELDQKFEPISQFKLIDTGNYNSEDPRLFSTDEGTYVSYTHLITFTPQVCNIAVSKIDLEKQGTLASYDLNYNKGSREKNWTPFVHRNQKGKDDVYIIYKYLPHRILKLAQPFNGNVSFAYENYQGGATLEKWEKKWGLIRGGTPAIKVGDEYISFFHSSFISGKILYYIFGAITFEGNPPFRITKISKAPIFFKDMYSTPVTEDVWIYPRNRVKVIFPSGVVRGKEAGRDVLYVVCGENDVAINCVVIDKETLLDSLENAY
jgi:predicted GH43/DUF377 family glycosyl hydrolase